MSAPSLEFRAIVQRLLRDLEPEDCESELEYEWALEYHALPLGIDLWSRVFLTPDGHVVWAGWEPLEIKRSRDEADLKRALRWAAERYPAMAAFVPREEELKEAWKQEQEKLVASIPMSHQDLRELFDHLDREGAPQCDHTLLRETIEFLQKRGLDVERIVPWLREFGGYCDCEVIYNLDDKFGKIVGR